MSARSGNRQPLALTQLAPRGDAEQPPRAVALDASASIPTGPLMRLSGIVKTTNGYAVAIVELSLAEWETIAKKSIGRSQRFKEHIATEHKSLVLKLGQTT